MISPPFLNIGDKIGIVAPARKIDKKELEPSFEIIRNYGFDVVYSDKLFSEDNQFAGNDKVRTEVSPVGKRTPFRGSFFAKSFKEVFSFLGSASISGMIEYPLQYLE